MLSMIEELLTPWWLQRLTGFQMQFGLLERGGHGVTVTSFIQCDPCRTSEYRAIGRMKLSTRHPRLCLASEPQQAAPA